ncbi:Aquaporin-9 [Zancudomyces culisetae]|uniref:Aquaporin-9 n=1 Tax=Zancudomyces culisetae TaxID=1213189 RepID=A0A1R1PWS4_ZANCU|nr:Aquaporin-9 [Zancudomyces culisetae]|eukprot:OMH85445.1 Aquaporin-9 [Zancudomyces culisetae]
MSEKIEINDTGSSSGSVGVATAEEIRARNIKMWDQLVYILQKPFRDYGIYLAEFVGTFIFVFLGTCSIATTMLDPKFSDLVLLMISFAWGAGLSMGLYVSAGISGGHLNPAVLGGFSGAALTFYLFYAKIYQFDGGKRMVIGDKATAGIFATYPAAPDTVLRNFLTECLLTVVLVLVGRSFTDKRVNKTNSQGCMELGILLFVIALGAGNNTGFALNPARDFGPRLFTLAAGYGTQVFSASNYYFWIPIVGPIFGAIIGYLIYEVLVIPNKYIEQENVV